MLKEEKDKELQELLTTWIYYTQQVFDKDWSYSRSMMVGINSLYTLGEEDDVTFLHPTVPNIYEDWTFRGDYLVSYRKLIALMEENTDQERGIVWKLVANLLEHTQIVFDKEWNDSTMAICEYNEDSPLKEEERTTFLCTRVGDNVFEKWSSRTAYLEAYYKLVAFMEENNIPLVPKW